MHVPPSCGKYYSATDQTPSTLMPTYGRQTSRAAPPVHEDEVRLGLVGSVWFVNLVLPSYYSALDPIPPDWRSRVVAPSPPPRFTNVQTRSMSRSKSLRSIAKIIKALRDRHSEARVCRQQPSKPTNFTRHPECQPSPRPTRTPGRASIIPRDQPAQAPSSRCCQWAS